MSNRIIGDVCPWKSELLNALKNAIEFLSARMKIYLIIACSRMYCVAAWLKMAKTGKIICNDNYF